ncbi:MAG TPA: tyrosine-type recombinase/integrase [Dehalococcoidia bacterium]|nr:tyrosine-type recombinase/integrase [Dehalococcoidia bacterium]
MVLDQLIQGKAQIGRVSGLDQLIRRGNLTAHLQAFLLSCRVDGLSPASLRDYRQKIGAFVIFCAGHNIDKPKRLTVSGIRTFLAKTRETNSPVSVADYYRCVKRFLNWMVEERMLKRNPMAAIRPPKTPRKVIAPFTTDHVKRLLLLCDDLKFLGARNKAIILMFLDTGLRLSELAGIQLKDVDFDREVIKVMGKGARERVVRIGRAAQKALLRYLLMREDDYPCLWVTEERRPLAHWGIELMIRKLGRRAGIEGVRCSPHTFRHTFATRALLNGAGEFEVQSLLGHEGLDMTRRYAASLRSEAAVEGHKRFSPVDNMGI